MLDEADQQEVDEMIKQAKGLFKSVARKFWWTLFVGVAGMVGLIALIVLVVKLIWQA